MNEMSDLLSLTDVARIADVSASTVHRRIRAGELRAVSTRPIQIRRADVQAWMTNAGQAKANPAPRAPKVYDRAKAERHFWSRVNKTSGCWLWTGAATNKGYGLVIFCGQRIYAHRLAWELTHGPIPTGLLTCHHCDVPGCVRPDHLFIGTPSDNTQDMYNKGRHPYTRHPRPYTPRPDFAPKSAKLNKQIAAQIRTLYLAGKTQQELADQFNVSHTTIYLILTDKIWKCGTVTYKQTGPTARRIAALEEEVARLHKELETKL